MRIEPRKDTEDTEKRIFRVFPCFSVARFGRAWEYFLRVA